MHPADFAMRPAPLKPARHDRPAGTPTAWARPPASGCSYISSCWLLALHREDVSAPVVEAVPFGSRRNVLRRHPDLSGFRVGRGPGVISPPRAVERRRVGEREVRT